MFTQRLAHAEKALLSAMAALLLLTTTGQSAMPTNSLPTAETPALSATTQLVNGSMEVPTVLASHRSCRSEHKHFCENGGECMYPQDSDQPACICTPSYTGHRCLFWNARSYTLPELEQLIGIIFGVALLVITLAFIVYCLVHRRCMKSATFKKLTLSELSV